MLNFIATPNCGPCLKLLGLNKREGLHQRPSLLCGGVHPFSWIHLAKPTSFLHFWVADCTIFTTYNPPPSPSKFLLGMDRTAAHRMRLSPSQDRLVALLQTLHARWEGSTGWGWMVEMSSYWKGWWVGDFPFFMAFSFEHWEWENASGNGIHPSKKWCIWLGSQWNFECSLLPARGVHELHSLTRFRFLHYAPAGWCKKKRGQHVAQLPRSTG